MQIHHFGCMEYRPKREPERRVEAYTDLADESRAKGDNLEDDRFLLLAWAAYDEQDGPLTEEESASPEILQLRKRA